MKFAWLKNHCWRLFFMASFAMILLTGCDLAPKYSVPSSAVAPVYKEVDSSHVWKPAEPKDSAIHGKWWEMYGDPQLNALEERVDATNQTLAAAAANYSASRAVVRQTRAQYFPTVGTTPSIAYSRLAVSPYVQTTSATTYTEYSFPITASWEPDLWGRIRNSVRASAYAAQASAADLENARLLAHASLATDYFQLRGVEQQKRILNATVKAWQNYLDLMRGLHTSGLATDEALAAAESQLEAAQAQETYLGIARAQYEHAIAILVGESPSSFAVPHARPGSEAARGSGGHSSRTAPAPPGHCLGGKSSGTGECTDRSGQSGLLSQHHARRYWRSREFVLHRLVHLAEPVLVCRSGCGRDDIRCRGANRGIATDAVITRCNRRRLSGNRAHGLSAG